MAKKIAHKKKRGREEKPSLYEPVISGILTSYLHRDYPVSRGKVYVDVEKNRSLNSMDIFLRDEKNKTKIASGSFPDFKVQSNFKIPSNYAVYQKRLSLILENVGKDLAERL